MMKVNFLFQVTLFFLACGCVHSIKEEKRIEQIFQFSSIVHISKIRSEHLNHAGKIIFGTKALMLFIDIKGHDETEIFIIRDVTYSKTPKKISYSTDKGNLFVILLDGKISEVTLFDGTYYTMFNKTQ